MANLPTIERAIKVHIQMILKLDDLFKYYIVYTGFLFAIVHINIIFIIAICLSFDIAIVSN
jgi:hypothetical protein